MLTINKKMELPADFVEMNESETALTGGVTEAGKTVAYVGAGIAGACVVGGLVASCVKSDIQYMPETLSVIGGIAATVAIAAVSIGAIDDALPPTYAEL